MSVANIQRLELMTADFAGLVAYWHAEYRATDGDLAVFLASLYDMVWEAGA